MMHEALMVNPYELDDAAEALHRALTMPKDEREVRMSHLRHREKINDVNYWMKSFLKVMYFFVLRLSAFHEINNKLYEKFRPWAP